MMVRVCLLVAASWFAVLASIPQSAYGCSSCGTGGADPVILNPSEARKLYLGLGGQGGFRDVTSSGQLRDNDGPETKVLWQLALAQRLTSRVFGSVVADYGLNRRANQQATGRGDIALNVRATLLQPTMLEAYVPQLQAILSHRFAQGQSVYDSTREHYLDVFGAGYDETYVGFDSWWGQSALMYGFSVLHGIPRAVSTPDGTLQLGPLNRFIGTLGMLLQPELKLIGGLVIDQRAGLRLDGEMQTQSDKHSRDLFLTAETLFPEADNLRLTLSRRGIGGENQNTVQAWSFVLAWMGLL